MVSFFTELTLTYVDFLFCSTRSNQNYTKNITKQLDIIMRIICINSNANPTTTHNASSSPSSPASEDTNAPLSCHQKQLSTPIAYKRNILNI